MKFLKIVSFVILYLLSGCATYTTPGGSVPISELADGDINELLLKQPAASFPVNLAVTRIQAAGYRSHRLSSYGQGRYSIVTTREVESEEDFMHLASLPGIKAVAPLNRILLPVDLESLKSLREASARLKADLLLVYTFDTSFHVGEQKLAPLNVITLGFLNNKKVSVTTTASAAIFDVRTEYLYGLAEATVSQKDNASIWSTSDVVDDLRVKTENEAFDKLIPEIEKTWTGIVEQYSSEKFPNQ